MSVLSKIKDFVARATQQLNPTGTLLVFAGATIPTGYLLCDGSAISRSAYAKLFGIVGTTYGAGDNSTTFNLPDFRNKTLWGANGNVGTVYTSGLPGMSGQASCIPWPTLNGDPDGAFSYAYATNSIAQGSTNVTNASVVLFDASRANKIYGASNIVQPPAIAVNVIIKY